MLDSINTERVKPIMEENALKKLWILTEERPKKEVIFSIVEKLATDRHLTVSSTDQIQILPIIKNGCFTFIYQVHGIACESVNDIFIKSVSGGSSFVDFLVFYQDEPPSPSDQPLYAIEETKTDDKESRNTGVYQRCSKFVFIHFYYPHIKKIMLYNLKVEQKAVPTDTYIFGTRMLITFGVEILGKQLTPNIFKPFGTLEELIAFKSGMRRPPSGNVPILIQKKADQITVSGRLIKSGGLAHDPNIGALTLICQCIRNFGWEKEIIITKHGLAQKNVGRDNKFIQIANQLDIKLEGLSVPEAELPEAYWKYETETEKLSTIFIHLVAEGFTNAQAIFENHAGCEKGYFQTPKGEYLALEKYENRDLYKAGDTSKRVSIPDLILFDRDRNEIINIEGKTFQNRRKGVEQLENYDFIENAYIRKHYNPRRIIRTVVTYGSRNIEITEPEIGFMLNRDGIPVLGKNAPQVFIEAVNNLLTSRG